MRSSLTSTGPSLTATAPEPDPFAAVWSALAAPSVTLLGGRLPKVDIGAVPGWAAFLTHRLQTVLGGVLRGEMRARLMVRFPFGLPSDQPHAPRSVVNELTTLVTAEDGRWWREQYPEGHRLRLVLQNNWLTAAEELHRHLELDRPHLCSTFRLPTDTPVLRVAPGLGDAHRGGRAVTSVHFEAGPTLIYKPRSVRPEMALTALLDAVAAATQDAPWPDHRALDRNDHGWVEVVERAPALDPEEEARFARRAGALLAVAHAIGMDDLHGENIIAVKDTPVVIDAETLMPAQCSGSPEQGWNPADATFAGSVLGTGLLPRWVPVYRQRLLGAEPQVAQLGGLGPRIAAPPVGSLGVEGRGAQSYDDTNLPAVPGQAYDISAHVDHVVAGFQQASAAIMDHRDLWSAPGAVLSMVWSTPVRAVPRNTTAYASALTSARSHAALRDTDARRRILLNRLGDSRTAPAAALRTQELAALSQEDIPLFVVPADQGRTEDLMLTAAPALAAREHLDALTPHYLAMQERLIRAVLSPQFTRPVAQSPTLQRSRANNRIAGMRVPLERVRAQIEHLADTLVGAACRSQTAGVRSVGWLSLHRDPSTARIAIAPTGPGLFQGSLGIALFLAEAGRVLDEPRWGELTATTVDTAVKTIQYRASEGAPRSGAIPDLGMMAGLGGHLWGFTRLASVLDRPDLLTTALELADAIVPAAARQHTLRLDLDAGVAGGVLGLTALAAATGSCAPLDWARVLGNRLSRTIAEQEDPAPFCNASSTSAAFGLAGLARALTALAIIDSDHRARWFGLAQLSSHRAGNPTACDDVVGWEQGATGQLATSILMCDLQSTRPSSAAADHVRSVIDSEMTAAVVDGLRRGTAGIVDVGLAAGLDLPVPGALLRPLDELRLIGPAVHPLLVPDLGDGLAGVGLTLTRFLACALRRQRGVEPEKRNVRVPSPLW